MMDEQGAKDKALAEIQSSHDDLPPIKDVHAHYESKNMSKGRGFKGWQVSIVYDIDMDPNESLVEIYDDTEEVVFVPII